MHKNNNDFRFVQLDREKAIRIIKIALFSIGIISTSIVIIIEIILFFSRDVYAMAPTPTIFITDLLDEGIIERTPLLQEGQTLNDIAHGWHTVTGGSINVGSIQEGKNKIMGIMVNGFEAAAPNWTHVEGLTPFNGNFSSVLYEMRAAGVKATSYGNLDSVFVENQYQTRSGLYSQYLRSYRESIGQGLNNAPGSYESGSVKITNRLINGLAR